MSALLSPKELGVWQTWCAWQEGVVHAVRSEFGELLHSVHSNDFDWDAWRPMFERGLSPLLAVEQALSSQPDSGLVEEVGFKFANPSASQLAPTMHFDVD